MKKVLMTSAAVLLMTATGFAQEASRHDNDSLRQEKKEKRLGKDRQQVQKNTSEMNQLLYKDFGTVTGIRWERIADYNWAHFTKDGQDITAVYDDNRSRVGTILPKTFNDLPATARAHINEHYPAYQKGDIILYDDNELNESDLKLYGQQFDEADNFFVTLQKGNKKLILKVDMDGDVAFFTDL